MTPLDLTTLELTAEQVAQQTGATTDRVRRLAAAGKLPGAKNVGTGSRAHWVLRATDLDRAHQALREHNGRRTLSSVAQEIRQVLVDGVDAGVADTLENGLLVALEIVTGESQPKRADPTAYVDGVNPVTVGGDPSPAEEDPNPAPAQVTEPEAPAEEVPHHELDTHWENAVGGQDTEPAR